MFYLFFILSLSMILGAYFICKYCCKFDNQKFNNVINKILKITVITYCTISILTILLPDSLLLSYDNDVLKVLNGEMRGVAILRWFGSLAFVMLPLAIFFKNITIRNISIYFCTIITLLNIIFYPTLIDYLTSTAGRGLNSISVIGQGFKDFLLNPIFRSIILGLLWIIELAIPIVLAVQEKHIFNVKNLKEYGYFFLILTLTLIACVPIYVPQHLFGYTDVIFEAWSIPHILWIISVIAEIIVLYFIFRNKNDENKRIMLFILSLNLLMQYNQMFGAISLNIERLPLQLCNIGSFLILFTLIFKSKKLFDFTIIVNVVGVLIALAIPDLDNEGLFYLYNMHFILEHTNVIIIPILALALGVFPRLDNKSLKHFLIGFACYFVTVLLLGTIFNGIASSTGNNFYSANYLFMFDKKTAAELLPFTESLFNIKFSIGTLTLYPVIQPLIGIVFTLICLAVYGTIRLIYFIKDKIKNQPIKETKAKK